MENTVGRVVQRRPLINICKVELHRGFSEVQTDSLEVLGMMPSSESFSKHMAQR